MKPVSRKDLIIKNSSIPSAGKGLYTKVLIRKGEIIAEYKGRITSWENADHANGTNRYLYYINRNHVIDAKNYKSSVARYANDGKGKKKIPGVSNNSTYIVEKKKVFIKAIKNIPPGSEILVSYGKEYWDFYSAN